MINIGKNTECPECKHWQGIKQPGGIERLEHGQCKAFKKIPSEILSGLRSHRLPYPGDKGIQFEAQ